MGSVDNVLHLKPINEYHKLINNKVFVVYTIGSKLLFYVCCRLLKKKLLFIFSCLLVVFMGSVDNVLHLKPINEYYKLINNRVFVVYTIGSKLSFYVCCRLLKKKYFLFLLVFWLYLWFC
jgi:hypothetical protein